MRSNALREFSGRCSSSPDREDWSARRRTLDSSFVRRRCTGSKGGQSVNGT